jgi:tetratricopeptide (TPR) repeat protein
MELVATPQLSDLIDSKIKTGRSGSRSRGERARLPKNCALGSPSLFQTNGTAERIVTTDNSPTPSEEPRSYTPLFHALNQGRYQRQGLIREYEAQYDCRLAVLADAIFDYSITYFEELLQDADPEKDLHLLLWSPGGDGEVAVRLVRAAQTRCRELVVVVPDQAKSAATLLALGAHRIMMSATSDLGPVDPQFELKRGEPLVAAKDIIAAVERATDAVNTHPDTYPIYATLLADVNAIIVQQAQSAIDRSGELLRQALASNPTRTAEEVNRLAVALDEVLVQRSKSHGALFGVQEALTVDLPVDAKAPQDSQWRALWRLYTQYFALGQRVYESRRASQVIPGHPFGGPI